MTVNTLRKGQKLINYLRKMYYDAPSLNSQDGAIRRTIFNLSDEKFDEIVNMSDKDCWEKVYDNDPVALNDQLMKEALEDFVNENGIKELKDINKKILEDRK